MKIIKSEWITENQMHIKLEESEAPLADSFVIMCNVVDATHGFVLSNDGEFNDSAVFLLSGTDGHAHLCEVNALGFGRVIVERQLFETMNDALQRHSSGFVLLSRQLSERGWPGSNLSAGN